MPRLDQDEDLQLAIALSKSLMVRRRSSGRAALLSLRSSALCTH